MVDNGTKMAGRTTYALTQEEADIYYQAGDAALNAHWETLDGPTMYARHARVLQRHAIVDVVGEGYPRPSVAVLSLVLKEPLARAEVVERTVRTMLRGHSESKIDEFLAGSQVDETVVMSVSLRDIKDALSEYGAPAAVVDE